MMIARTRTSLRKFLGDRRGSPALEFALVAPLFFAGVFGAMELGRGLYERNQFAAAASFATREIAKDPSLTAAQLKTLIESELGYNPGELTLDITDSNRVVAGQEFKEINISYRFNFLVKIGHDFSGLTLSTTRYAPVID